jgi:uncharacterized protein YdbL (DUF1318 family)
MSTDLVDTSEASSELAVVEEQGKGVALVDAKARQRQAWELRHLRRMKWADVADECGYASDKVAMDAAKKFSERTDLEPVEEYRTMQIDKAEDMLRALEKDVQRGDTRAIDTSLRVMQYLDHHVGIGEQQTQRLDVEHKITITTTMSEDDYVKAMAQASPALERGPSSDEPIPDGMIANPFVEDAVLDAEVVE